MCRMSLFYKPNKSIHSLFCTKLCKLFWKQKDRLDDRAKRALLILLLRDNETKYPILLNSIESIHRSSAF